MFHATVDDLPENDRRVHVQKVGDHQGLPTLKKLTLQVQSLDHFHLEA